MKRRTRLVIALARGQVALGVARRGTITVDTADIGAIDDAASAVRQLLGSLNASGAGRTIVDVLICKPLASCKALFHLSAADSPQDVRKRVGASPHTFFLGEPGAICVGTPLPIEGAWWATAVDRPLLESLLRTLSAVDVERCRVRAIDAVRDAAGLSAIVRSLADAPTDDPLALDPLAEERRAGRRRRRLRAFTASLALGATIAAFGPLALHATLARRETHDLVALRRAVSPSHAWAQTVAAARLDDHARMSELAARYPLRTPLVSSLGRALPSSAQVVSLAVDSTAGNVVVLAPPSVNVLQAVVGVATVVDARLEGAVTRERLGEREVNRTTVAFRLAPPEEPR